ncbi:MAG TPA: Gfo/Idh/MocA family oxidoreductase [Caldisericia bacterium]|nr:Gfo/Idh/MocA family oxidoreductase [Caldisericia bacterium]
MNIVVFGLGSMGKRRIKKIKSLMHNAEIIGIDINIERCKDVEKEFGVTTASKEENLLQLIHADDCAFVCTHPKMHAEIIMNCLRNNRHVFTELNLQKDCYREIIDLQKNSNKVLFQSCTPIFRKEIAYVSKLIGATKCKLNYNYHVGQYLPDWHPWESYKDFFVGEAKYNACREIFAIELPWLIRAFGPIKEFSFVSGTNTKLDLNYNDNYMGCFIHENGTKGQIEVDVISRKPIRNLEVYGEELHLFWDGKPDGLKKFNIEAKELETISLYNQVIQDSRYSDFIIEDMYAEEIKCFFDCVHKKLIPPYTLEDDEYTLTIIDRIEKESRQI